MVKREEWPVEATEVTGSFRDKLRNIVDITYTHYESAYAQAGSTDLRSFADDFGALSLNPAWQAAGGAWTLDTGNGEIDSSGTADDVLLRELPHSDGVVKFRYRLNSGTVDEGLSVVFRSDPASDLFVVTFAPDYAIMGEQLGSGTGLVDYQASAGSALGTWYEVTVAMDGDQISVYRAADGAAPVRVFHGQATTLMSGPVMGIVAPPGCYASVSEFSFTTLDSGEYVARYNAANEMIWNADNEGRTAYTYDAWGRTLTKSRAVDASTTHTANYGYSFGQRLKWVTTDFPGEESASYNYDGLGKRRNKLVDGDITWFRWDAGWNMIAEYDGGAVQTDWDPGNLEMSYIPGLAQVPGTNPATGAYAYFASDHLGTVRGVYNQSKTLTAALDYSPYGEPYSWCGNVPATTYTGHYWDGESSMYFAPYRYYMPDAGRWLTRDPLGMVDGPNVYAYVGGRPIMANDPTGKSLVACVIIIVAGAIILQGCSGGETPTDGDGEDAGDAAADDCGDPCEESQVGSCEECAESKYAEAVQGTSPFKKLSYDNILSCAHQLCAGKKQTSNGAAGEKAWNCCIKNGGRPELAQDCFDEAVSE